MTFTAAQLPGVRDDLVKMCRSGLIPHLLANHILAGGTVTLPRPECEAGDFGRATARYAERLANLADVAELYHVSAEMTAVAGAARGTMPGYRLHPEDLPAERGLIVFDAPIGVFDVTNEEVDFEHLSEYDRARVEEYRETGFAPAPAVAIGALWGPADAPNGSPGVLVVTWSDTTPLLVQREQEGVQPHELSAMRQTLGGLTYHDETVLPFGDFFDPDAGEDAPIRNQALGTLITTWLLMGQPIVTAEPEPLPRQIRRARERARKPVPDVRVVRLRHAQRTAAATEQSAGRTYRHRWFVRGHWRNQWYPSRNDHRPIYIMTRLQGPEGAPILDPEKVYDWRK